MSLFFMSRSKEPLPQRNVKIKILLTKAKILPTSAAYKVGQRSHDSSHITDSGKSLDISKAIKKLAVLTENPAECTHLVSSVISRTSKFLRAMNVAPFVLKPEWVTESAKACRLLRESPCLLGF
jgi:Ulp1 family protease